MKKLLMVIGHRGNSVSNIRRKLKLWCDVFFWGLMTVGHDFKLEESKNFICKLLFLIKERWVVLVTYSRNELYQVGWLYMHHNF